MQSRFLSWTAWGVNWKVLALALGLWGAAWPALGADAPADKTAPPASAFAPGEVWRDTAGHPINAHGGGVLFHNGVYYWYGEVKEGRTYLPACNRNWGGTRVPSGGVSCYSSTNLYEWKKEKLVLTPVADPQSDLHFDKVMERPKVIYNKSTKKFVMWLHVDSMDYKLARAGVAVSDAPTGPFTYLGSFRPNAGVWPENASDSDKQTDKPLARDFAGGQMARDMTVFVDDDGQAYHFYSSEENPTMHVSLLTDDYLRPAGKYRRIFMGRSMEAPTVFRRGAKYYLIASGCSGWLPNEARLAVADNIFGPWTELGNPCRGPGSKETFQSQGAFILPVAGLKDGYVFMADRWKQWDLADSRYIWLPLEFAADGQPVLRWRNRWSLPSGAVKSEKLVVQGER